ncbi:hypothetical protein GQ600_4154 [Phytophthora cactorum]|nr:hypothetical protein GQ600_4154 [Phytophthora cactorum]
MGLAITKLGMFTEKDLIAMRQWQEEIPKLEAVSDLASWTRVSSFPSVIAGPFNNCVNVNTKACASHIETVNLKATVSTRFDNAPVHEVASFRRSVCLDDACFMRVMSYLMDKSYESLKQRGIDVVNPLYARMADDSIKRSVIESTSPFESEAMCFEAHWSGVVFKTMLAFFDPMQSKATTKLCQRVRWRACVRTRESRQRAPRQEDTNSYGPLTLLFFECMARGLPVPTVLLESILYLRFLYMFLASKGGFCRNTDVDTGKPDGTPELHIIHAHILLPVAHHLTARYLLFCISDITPNQVRRLSFERATTFFC